MSEDRHSLSAPRPVSFEEKNEGSSSQLAWEVDVFRAGVDTPVETLRIDDTTLPPRANKKGKIVWRLPTEEGKLPNFGTDERRRIMELFKERKKSRRKKGSTKQSSKPASESASGSVNGSISSNGSSHSFTASGPDPKQPEEPKESVESFELMELKEKANGKEKKTRVTAAAALAARRKKSNAAAATAAAAADPDKSQLQPPLPLPPGFQDDHPPHENGSQTSEDAEPPKPPESCPDSRYIVIPQHERPPPLPSSTLIPSLAVPVAKRFVDFYYPLITHGLSADLAMHYTPNAQKSVSVGGAHSVVTGRQDIAMQIASLSGATFVVRGVVAQDTFDHQGAHILVTGLIRMALSPSNAILHQTTLAPFAHSISLTPTTAMPAHTNDPYAFQIHNDALSLLTAEAEISADAHRATTLSHAPPPHMQQHAQTHRHSGPHPPPPGLFG
uniref:NTF2 domain-containing protein n=2 Tax=Ditylum brightwellii TaxID=49249 RepID=A0A6S8XWT2_9STRA|mmetsp:Transcript_2519/g.2775  ORF Transcript_2519/g.2775 Transcript_2519/m.2775 type:complete len:444 (+) Transcript_2519:108-1439(+)